MYPSFKTSPKQAPVPPPRPTHWPVVPDRLEALDVPSTVAFDLALRHVRVQGTSTLLSLSQSLKLSTNVVETIFHNLRQRQLLHVEGMLGNDYQFRLTQTGREVATQPSELGQYAGPVPVSVQEYTRMVRAQMAHPKVTRSGLRLALTDLVLSDAVLDQLGPALITNKSIFLYGPTGGGKTSIAERLLRLYEDTILVPYAIHADGHIVMLFDPVVHRSVGEGDEYLDQRWVRCRRPCVMVGGELVSGMLELRLDESTGIYAAPLQMKANNGILIIDDFGRQVISPRELLNRWIVPLDRRVDYLMLRHGVQVEVPFEMLVVFSTNLDPAELADEAFLRRIHNKVYVEAVGAEAFDEIFTRATAKHDLPAEFESGTYLRQLCMRFSRSGLRACYPGDICEIIGSISAYEDRPPRITRAELERAVELYFTRK